MSVRALGGPRRGEAMSSRACPGRILIVALDNLGDLVFASALTPPLRRAFPDARIDVWCKAYTAPVARLMPHVGDVIAADPFWAVPPHRARPSVRAFVRSISRGRENRYDLALLSEAPWRVAAAVAAARIPVRVGMQRHRNRLFLTRVLAAEDPNKPVVREQARLLEAIGVESEEPRYQLDASKIGALRDAVALALPPRCVALHPFASARNRCVALSEWMQVALAVQSRGAATVW